MTRPLDPQPPRWGFSYYHDRVLDWCRANYRTCPFNCAKNGAPNCFHHVAEQECEPSKAVPYVQTK